MELDVRIINEARALIKSEGITFKMDEIATALSISKKTIYKYYNSKEVILKRIIDEAKLDVTQQQRDILFNMDLPNIEKFKRILKVLPKENDIYLSSSLRDLNHYYPELYEYLNENLRLDWEPVYQLMDQLMHSGEIQPINKDVFQQMYLSAYQFMDKKGNNASLKTVLEEVISILIDGVIYKETE